MSSYQQTQEQETDPIGDPSSYYTQQQQALGYYQYSDEVPEIYVEGQAPEQAYAYSYDYPDIEEDEEPPTPTASTSRHHRHSKKSSKDKGSSKRRKDSSSKAAAIESGSDTEREEKSKKMSSRSSRHHSSTTSSSKKDKSSSKPKSDDWTEITEPEERRRIQNRIAQRKFREKAREQKDRAQRDAQNAQYASGSYRIPSPSDLPPDSSELSGLPWGSLDMRHVIQRGHEATSAASSPHTAGSRSSGAREPTVVGTGNPYFLSPYTAGGYASGAATAYYTGSPQAGGEGSSGDDGVGAGYYEGEEGQATERGYYYDYDFERGL